MHPNYSKVNQTLQNLFAEAAMPVDMRNFSVAGSGLKLCEGLMVDEARTKLELRFKNGTFSTTSEVCSAMSRHWRTKCTGAEQMASQEGQSEG